MMFSVWISLSLLYLVQHSVSSDDEVSLICPKTVSVISGKKVVQNCSIEFKNGSGCEVEDSELNHSNGTTKCGNDSEPYSCAWDTNSTMTVTIVGVKEDNITVEIHTKCGWASDDIHVHINVDNEPHAPRTRSMEEESTPIILGVLVSVIVVAVVVAILSCLIKKLTSKKNQEHTMVSQQDPV